MIRRRLLLLGLFLSVAVNLFFIGGVGYRMAQMSERREARPLPPNLGWIVRDLSENRREQLSDELRASAAQILPLRRAVFASQRRVNELMAAPDFDAAALQQAFSELREASNRYQQATQEQTVIILAELTPEERQSARDFVRRRGTRDGSDGPGRPRPPGDRPPR
jgi:uncharacterized membrane protein